MSIRPDHPTAIAWAQEWQRLSWTATSQMVGQFLHDCAHLAMTRTPQQAFAALHRTQTGLLRHSATMLAKATTLWHEQNAELLVMRGKHARPSQRGPVKS
jgi:hypothetical protein